MVREFDYRGLLCPLPVLKARKALRDLPAGSRARFLVTDPKAPEDFRHFCESTGHRLVRIEARDNEGWVVEVERRA